MKRWMISLLVTMQCVGAAELAGRWRADSTFPRGTKVVEYFDLLVEGAKVAGTFTDGFGGKHEIRDGKVQGDAIWFWMIWEKNDKCQVSGAMKQGNLELKMVTPGATRAVTARRE